MTEPAGGNLSGLSSRICTVQGAAEAVAKRSSCGAAALVTAAAEGRSSLVGSLAGTRTGPAFYRRRDQLPSCQVLEPLPAMLRGSLRRPGPRTCDGSASRAFR